MLEPRRTVKEASALLDMHPVTLRKKIKLGEIGYEQNGRYGSIHLTDSHIQEYRDRITIPPKPLHNPSSIPTNYGRMEANEDKEDGGMARANHKSRRNFYANGSVRLRHFKHCSSWVKDYRDREGKRVVKVIKHAQTEEEAYAALEDAIRKEFDSTYRAQEEVGKMDQEKITEVIKARIRMLSHQ